ncbi:transposase [Viridibacillus soli]|uniref:transposase n=1 Tax=Viridibacillus soli TaxID=2798301 RepID=UPI00389A5EC3
MVDTVISPLSNGIMEGTNNKIKFIKRRGFWYRNDAHFFLRLRLETGRYFCHPRLLVMNHIFSMHLRFLEISITKSHNSC